MVNFESYLKMNIDSLLSIAESDVQALILQIRNTINHGGILWLAGNGGSASTASHASCDLSKGVSLKNGEAVRSYSFMDQLATMTAWANDFSYDTAIASMCGHSLKREDLLLVISASGNSKNMVNAVLKAKELRVPTASLTGYDGGEIAKISDFNVNVPSSDMQVIENAHLIICHWLYKDL